ncbi:MAG TPA: GTPase HflX, partial [Cyclobacteriaceae bacterium]
MGKLAILVAVESGKSDSEITNEYLNELAFLAETAGIKTIERFVQRLPHADARTYVGKGKFAEIKEFIAANSIDNVIFDDDLSPSQLRNIERELN